MQLLQRQANKQTTNTKHFNQHSGKNVWIQQLESNVHQTTTKPTNSSALWYGSSSIILGLNSRKIQWSKSFRIFSYTLLWMLTQSLHFLSTKSTPVGSKFAKMHFAAVYTVEQSKLRTIKPLDYTHTTLWDEITQKFPMICSKAPYGVDTHKACKRRQKQTKPH